MFTRRTKSKAHVLTPPRCSYSHSNTTTVLAQFVLFIWCFTLVLRHMGVFVALPPVVVGVLLIMITLAVFAHAISAARAEVRGGANGNADMSNAATTATAAAVAAVENAAAVATAASEGAVGEVKAALEKQLASLRRLTSRGLNTNDGVDVEPDISTEQVADTGTPDAMGLTTADEEEKEEQKKHWAEEFLCGEEEEKA